MWAGIFGLLTSLPKLLKYAEAFAAWFQEQLTLAKNAELKKRMEKGVADAKETGDTSAVEDLFRKPGGK